VRVLDAGKWVIGARVFTLYSPILAFLKCKYIGCPSTNTWSGKGREPSLRGAPRGREPSSRGTQRGRSRGRRVSSGSKKRGSKKSTFGPPED
jgi:hypothetical protein